MRPVLDLPAEDRYLTVRELAEYLRYRGPHAPRQARRWIDDKGVSKHYRSAQCLLVKRSDVDRALEGHV